MVSKCAPVMMMMLLAVLPIVAMGFAVDHHQFGCTANCTKFGVYHCHHTFTCPTPPCDNPVQYPGDCCPYCEKDCPHPCVEGGQHYCYPLPCPLPPCPDPITPPGECCPKCHPTP